jgi:hypothetical protein
VVTRELEDRLLARSGEDHNRSRVWPGRDLCVPDALKSAGVGLLLFAVVASTIAGAEAAFLFTVLAAWLLFPLLVGLRNTLDAGCAFTLISVGVMLVVGLAHNGPGYLLP